MKKIVTPYIVLCIVVTCVSNFSFAQNTIPPANDPTDSVYCTTQSSICATAPKDFTALLSFVREMSNAIKTIWPEWAYLGKYVNPNRFQWNAFTAPKQSLVGRVARNITQKISFGVATIAIFSSPVNIAGLKDMLWWVVLLSKNKVFLRDNKLVEQLESQLNDKKYELGLWWWWYAQVIPENRTIFQGIIKKYIDAWLLVGGSINDGVSYNNITSLLTQILSAAKSFLYFGSMDQFNVITRGAADQGISIRFDDLAMQNIQRDYACARWPNYICSSEHKTLKKIFSSSWKSLSSGAGVAKKTFLDAVDRLWQVFSPSQQDDAFKAREADLLRSMYGTTKISKGTLADSLKKTWSSVKKSWAEVGQQVADLGSDINTFRTFPKDLKGASDSLPSSIISSDDSTYTITDDKSTKLLDSYINDVFINQKTDLDLVSMAEVKGVTPAFKVLWDQLSIIKNDILGGKDNKSSLLWSLWAACELQCGGWWSCR